MSLLDRLKTFLGLTSPGEPAQEDPVAVTVEREAGQAGEDGDGPVESPGSDRNAEASTEVSTETAQEPPEPSAAVEEDAAEGEPAEEDAVDADAEAAVDTAAEADTDADADADIEEDVDGDPAAATESAGDPVTDISGIGPAYSERLANADITTVSELADADPAELASQADISETRLTGWIEDARERANQE